MLVSAGAFQELPKGESWSSVQSLISQSSLSLRLTNLGQVQIDPMAAPLNLKYLISLMFCRNWRRLRGSWRAKEDVGSTKIVRARQMFADMQFDKMASLDIGYAIHFL